MIKKTKIESYSPIVHHNHKIIVKPKIKGPIETGVDNKTCKLFQNSG